MKYIGIIIGILVLVWGINSFSANFLPYRSFDLENTNGIVRFVDPDNGNVCYVALKGNYYQGTGISCLKP